MKKKLIVGILCGGKSSEHQISLLSASNIISAIPKNKYQVVPIGIDKNGSFFQYKLTDFILHPNDPKKISLSNHGEPVTFSFGKLQRLVYLKSKKSGPRLDVLFPVLHGLFGEDGTIQGLAELSEIPYVGPGVLGSAIGMDKDVAKRLLRDAKIPIADFVVFNTNEKSKIRFAELKKKFGIPFFVKPARSGSSIGTYKVREEKELKEAIAGAFNKDNKLLVEKMMIGTEIECSVLGNEKPEASLPGEVLSKHDFYSYEAKYLDKQGAEFKIPAKLSKNEIKNIQQTALNVYRTLNCDGMARVDGFLQKDGTFVINEINTIPGFTSISMYPKLWEVSGLSYPDLIDKLIQLALEKKRK